MIHLTDDDEVTRQLVADYAGSSSVRISNIWDSKHSPYSAEEIVRRAKSKLGHYEYNTLTSNCEHFATWCRYNKFLSMQSLRTVAAWPVTLPAIGLSKLFGGISSSSRS
ncbi:hypothetical protein WR25_06595 [Diploscapter pachys]|uniref:LRAT domain-containing protein n=1 Tax=Diploscapter pachys TaxID=2018661 RepID=A0A2A2KT03_9BILA|nr:hypothetical protein WR25_06595 [Diploscapter pachys]